MHITDTQTPQYVRPQMVPYVAGYSRRVRYVAPYGAQGAGEGRARQGGEQEGEEGGGEDGVAGARMLPEQRQASGEDCTVDDRRVRTLITKPQVVVRSSKESHTFKTHSIIKVRVGSVSPACIQWTFERYPGLGCSSVSWMSICLNPYRRKHENQFRRSSGGARSGMRHPRTSRTRASEAAESSCDWAAGTARTRSGAAISRLSEGNHAIDSVRSHLRMQQNRRS